MLWRKKKKAAVISDLKVPVIMTKRLIMTVPEKKYATQVADYWYRNRAHFTRWAPARNDEFYTEDYWQKKLVENIQVFKDFTAVHFYLFTPDKRKVIGQCAYTHMMFSVFQCCYLNFTLDVDEVGQGYMSEALRLGNQYIFGRGLHRIQAHYLPVNERSAALLKHLNFTVEGYAREYLYINGAWRDHILTSLVNTTS